MKLNEQVENKIRKIIREEIILNEMKMPRTIYTSTEFKKFFPNEYWVWEKVWMKNNSEEAEAFNGNWYHITFQAGTDRTAPRLNLKKINKRK